jgi:ABC-type dipeptide/oligopeptide/nickel transport system permease component
LYVARRLLLAVPTLLVVSFIVFAAVRVAPGDPAAAMAGLDAPREVVEEIRRELGLDRPLIVQYSDFLWDAIHLDLGRSLFSRQPVVEELAARFPSSISLAISAIVLATTLGVAAGLLAATRAGTLADHAIMIGVTAFLAIPAYVVGLVLVLIFAAHLHWLPASGASTPLHYVLPTITLAIPTTAIIARQTRSAVLEVYGQDYIRTARAKGLQPRTIVGQHAMRNALIPIITVVGIWFGALVSGLVIIETIFAIPGVGGLIVERILARDYPVVQGGVLLLAVCVLAINLVVDLSYGLADPRIHYA